MDKLDRKWKRGEIFQRIDSFSEDVRARGAFTSPPLLTSRSCCHRHDPARCWLEAGIGLRGWRRYKNKGNGGAGCRAGQEATPGHSEESAEARDPPARSDLDADRPEASCEDEERPGMDDLDHCFYPPAKRSGLRPLANEARSRDH